MTIIFFKMKEEYITIWNFWVTEKIKSGFTGSTRFTYQTARNNNIEKGDDMTKYKECINEIW